MMHLKTFKTQLALVITSIVVLVILANATFLINTKTIELQSDIYKNAIRFANLTVSRIMDAYYRDFKNNSFAAFVRSIEETFKINSDDIIRMQIVSYPTVINGQDAAPILYDTETPDNEISSRVGKTRITDPVLLQQIRFQYPNFRLAEKDIFYGITENQYVDATGNKATFFSGQEEIQNVVWPYLDNQHSVVFYVSYAQLSKRIDETAMNVLFFTFLAIAGSLGISFLIAQRITDPIKMLTQNVLHIAKGDFSKKIHVRSSNEIGILAETFNKMTTDLSQYQNNLIEQEKMHQEIQLAADIQQNLLPKKLPDIKGLEIAAGVNPAIAVGGDVYDFIPFDQGDVLFYIGDVTGHGIPASLIASITNTLIFSLKQAYTAPKDIALAANNVLYSKTKKDMFVTMIIARWYHSSRTIRYTCAGHDQIIRYQSHTHKVILEPKGGIALGMVSHLENQLENRDIKMEEGDFIILYSDGIPEAMNPDSKRYSMTRLQQTVQRCHSLHTAQQIYDFILQDVRHFMHNQAQSDDITLIVIKCI